MSAVLVRVAACMLLLTVGQLAAMRCWQYTWPGVVDWNSPIDNETTCEGKTEPCIEPFVLSMNSTEPNMTKLQELCESGGCPPELWCNTKGGESCVKYAFWTTDVTTNELKIVNYSRFCGSARSGNADTGVFSTVVNDGCYQQQINSFILETCFCHGSYLCNGANGLSTSAGLLALLVASSIAAAAAGIWRT
ncbi:uncharacterized protein LOC122380577 [Amphibalanus amphitrite]|uniref:uncharacterized protein LOC122380577 n=1 Tax=Amphibalanus amphitrite TaxID=1232801 RepID=UPI001C909E54|nr:uncharacterized protein LOC122380577 [Amphibalanus amphitrite]